MEINEQHKKLFKRAYELIKEETESFADNPYKIICDLANTIPTIEAYYGCLEDIISACGTDSRKKASFTLFPLTESTFNINLKKRTITSPKNQQVSVEGDKLSTTIIFTVDRYYETIDLSQDVTIKIYYQTKETMGAVKCYTVNLIDDINFTDKIRFGWVLDDTYILNSGKDVEFFISFEKKLKRIINETLDTEIGKISEDGEVIVEEEAEDEDFKHTDEGIFINKGEVLKLNQSINNIECYYSTSADTSDALANIKKIEPNNQQYINNQDESGYFFFNIPIDTPSDLKYTIISAEWCLNTLLQEMKIEKRGFEITGTITSIEPAFYSSSIKNSSEICRGYTNPPIFTFLPPEKVELEYNKSIMLKAVTRQPLEGLVKYTWKDSLGNSISTDNTCTIDTPGDYSVVAQTIISQNNVSEETPPANFEVIAIPFDSPIFSTNFSKKAVIEAGQSLTLSISVKNSTEGKKLYQWYKDDRAITSATDKDYTVTEAGSYYATVQFSAGEGSPYNSSTEPSNIIRVSNPPDIPYGGENEGVYYMPTANENDIYSLDSNLTKSVRKGESLEEIVSDKLEYRWYYSKTKIGVKTRISTSTPWIIVEGNELSQTLKIAKKKLPQNLYIWCECVNIVNDEKSAPVESKTFICSP